MNANEKQFCEAVARKYLEPTPATYHSTLTVMDAAYEVAKEQGAVILPDDESRAAFFHTFMDGLMEKANTLKYIDDLINTIRAEMDNKAACKSESISRLKGEMVASMKTILDSASAIRAKALKVNCLSDTFFPPLFKKDSYEWDALADVARQLGMTL